ncbi:ABC transporter permease [Mucilaginibacter gotjawali]|uniref:ABC-type antimicrobial peptide transport system permease subunit n=2 Tax=Mucilaginibacter gotjawali TaxID=1550579 RepID=A0A839SBY9_9SPHI|nr:ABC transporter permease [Mucilaginibacter gotjawali]MBB3055675.1 ABC-type antimicrobial peptide transport system permease subunit [Mucilaginibacter gotjawali]BAU54494.1 Macrolide export ATP-binding/permease protein MacB [Mucilaginibacter gotjawali]
MLKNYLKIAWRNLGKNRLYSIINIGGLAIGMAVSFILLIYVYNEFSFDKFNTNSDRLYRVMRNQPSNGEILTGDATPVPLAPAMIKDFPEIDRITRATWPYDRLVNYKNQGLKVNTMAADPSFLQMFTVDFIYGNKKDALSDLSSIVLTESAAKAIFGNINPVGQVVKLDQKFPLRVSGVIKDNPANSSFNFKALINWDQISAEQNWIKTSGWGNYSFKTFVMLKPGTSAMNVDSKLKNIIARYNPDNKENTIFLYPFAKFHLYGDFKNGVNAGGRVGSVELFLWLAIGILIIACINFMNLSTARSERRAREVGVRKAIGAARFSLIAQFMGESLLMAFISFLFSLLFIWLLIPVFGNFINIKLQVPYGNLYAWLSALGVTAFTGLVAGSYPALFLSSFSPVLVLKGQLSNSKSTVTPRKILVILQFTFAICLILSSIFIYKQINYIKDEPIGYDRFGLVDMPVEGAMDTRFEDFRREAISAGAITDGALTSMSIVNNGSSSWGITWQGQLPGEDKIPIDQMAVTYHFVKTYGVKLTEGRDFSPEYPSDTAAIILNEAAVKMMRFKEPLGQLVKYQDHNCKVVGVIENFVWGSPYDPVKPAIIGFIKGWTGNISLRLNPAKPVSASLDIIRSIYKKYNPDYPFEYHFTDEKYNNKFNNERLLGNMSICFTCLAIVISCLGLFGLASFSAEQRKKEIGIRKVLGATTGNLWFNLSREFVWLIGVSFAIGSVLTMFYIHHWMTQFTYHTTISLWVFVVTLILSLTICLITVSWQALKAALSNPVTSLRSE